MWTPDPAKIITAEQKAAEAAAALQEVFSAAIQRHLNAKARERQYDSIARAITYRDDPNPHFAAEGQALFAWRSAVWTYAATELAKVMAGERTQPSVEEFLLKLETACPFEWPTAEGAMGWLQIPPE